MSVFTYHLIKPSLLQALKIMFSPLMPKNIKGLIHAETMSVMILGSPTFSVSRIFSREIVVFAQWRTEDDFEKFIKKDAIGKLLSKGWFVKLQFIRQWGSISGFEIPDATNSYDHEAVVAVTIARMKYKEIPRFIRWGRPVEKLVRDHSGTTLSLASIRHPNVVSTFSIWKTQKEMTDMVKGHSKVPQPERHFDAMKERDRKDFHFEFTTLRFRPIKEVGIWKGRSNYIPKLPNDL